MNQSIIKRPTKILLITIIIVFFMFFVLETLLWMLPIIHHPLLKLLDNPILLDFSVQAIVLKGLFINQGFYNLFLAISGVIGFRALNRGHQTVGLTLLVYMCLSSVGAGIVLACSTKAYILAIGQIVPAVIALRWMYQNRQRKTNLD